MKKLLLTTILALILGLCGYSQSVTLNNVFGCYSNGGTINVSFTLSSWPASGVWVRSITGGNGSWSLPNIIGSSPNQTYVSTYTMNAADTTTGSFSATITVSRTLAGVTTTRTGSSIITINTKPGIRLNPVNVNTCGSTSTTFAVSASGNNLTYVWQQSANSGLTWSNVAANTMYSGNTTAVLSISNINSTLNNYRYRCRVNCTGLCSSSYTISNAATLVVIPASGGGILSSSTSVCSGTNSTLLSLAAYVGTIVKWQYSTNNWSTYTDIPNTTASFTATNLTTTTKYRVVVQSGSCSTANSSEAILTVGPGSVGGTVAGSTSVCYGVNSTTLTLSGYNGTIVRWQSSTNNWSTFTNITNTTTTLTATNLILTTKFRAVVQNGVCPSVNSSEAMITVNPPTIGGSIGGSTTVCTGTNSSTLTLSGQSGAVVKWQSSTNNWVSSTDIPNTTTTFTASNLTTSTVYRVVVQNPGCSPEYSAEATITVNSASIGGSVSGGLIVCSGSNSCTLTLAGYNGSILYWQMSTDNWATATQITNSTTTLTASNLTSTTKYRAVVQSGVCNSVNSGDATVTVVLTQPTITSQPSAASPCNGSGTSFSISATGSGLIYQWQMKTPVGSYSNLSNSSPYSGVTSSVLTISTATLGMNGNSYRCEVSAPCPLLSNDAILTINTPPVTDNPTDSTVCAGNNSSFDVTATGSILSYYWQLSINNGSSWSNLSNNSTYSGAATSILSITAATTGMNGNLYRCYITGACPPSATSSSAKLTVNSLPVVLTTSGNSAVCQGIGTSFNITASGTGISYIWQVNNGSGYVNITAGGGYYTGYTSATLTLSTTSLSINGYNYRCCVSGTCTPAAISSGMLLTVNTDAGIDVQPSATSVCVGSGTTMSVTAHGTGLTYFWQLKSGASTYTNLSNNSTYSGVGSNTLTFSNAGSSLNANVYRCYISGTCSSVSSNDATLTVNELPNITTQPHYNNNGTNPPCEDILSEIEIHATGAGLVYQWQLSTDNGSSYTNLSNTTMYQNVTSNQFKIAHPALSMSGNKYRCYLTGSCSPPQTSTAITFNVWENTNISSEPINAEICQGSGYSASFTTIATGKNLSYQWELYDPLNLFSNHLHLDSWNDLENNSIYTGTHSSVLSIANATMAMNGNIYHCIITGDCNSKTTVSVTLTVDPTTVGGSVAANTDICLSSNITNLVLSGHTGSVLRWEFSTNNWVTTSAIANVTSGLTVTNLSVTTSYRAVVQSGICNSATSAAATLTVHILPTVTFTGTFADQHLCGDPVTLSGGTPSGGTYSGLGVSDGKFDPSVAGPGLHTITYTFQNSFGCSNSATNTITVMEPETSVFMIGDGGDYTNLTGSDGLFNYLNINRRCGNVIAVIMNNLTETGNHGLNESIDVFPGNYSITIIPLDETQKVISGNCPDALIRLYGIDNLTIDGGIFWPYRALKFVNNNSLFPTLFVGNGVSNSWISACEFEGNNSNPNSGVVVLESTLANNSNVVFNRNIFGNISQSTAAPSNLFIAKGSGIFFNSNIDLQGNEFENYSSNGILVTGSGNGSNWDLYNNSFYATLLLSSNQTAINFTPGASSINNTFTTNYIGGTTYQIYGSNFENTGAGTFKGISVSSGNSTISNNFIGNIKLSSTGAPTFTGIEVLSGTATINQGNIIGSDNISYSITMKGTGNFEGIKSISTSAVSIKGNTISNINYSGNLGSPKATCIFIKRGSVDKNRILNIGCYYTTMTPIIYGIDNEANNTGNMISNNMILLKGGNAGNPRMYGIYDKSVGNSGSIIHNTVLIQGTLFASATNLTTAFYRDGTTPVILYNNILHNTKTNTASAKNYAIYSTSSNAITTNYNDLVSAAQTLVYWSGITYTNLSSWKTTGRDVNSISVTPVYVSVSDLHLTTANTGINNKGSAVNSIGYDFDDSPRSASTPDIGADEFSTTAAFMAAEPNENEFAEPTLSIYPNPVSSNAMISVTLGKESIVRIRIYNIVGKLVQSINEQLLPAGNTIFEFNSMNLSPGMYICHMTVNSENLLVQRLEIIR